MTRPIKVVYSWIGPKGPIINTELPNILCFAAVAENTAVTSHNFWADDLWWRVFLNNDPYVLASTQAIDEKEIFIFPFTLGWRISFTTYFYGKTGLLEFSHTPDHILHHVRSSKGYFLIDCTAEAWVHDDHIQAMHDYFSFYNHIPMEKIIYLTGCMNAQDTYDDWCNRHGIVSRRDKMIMMSFPVSQHGIYTNSWKSTEPEYDTTSVPEKLFLCWNRRFRQHRSALLIALDKLGLVDRSYYSMGRVDPENISMKFENHAGYFLNWEMGDQTDINAIVKKLPLKIDGLTTIGDMCQDFDSAARSFYSTSLLSLVTETNYDSDIVTLTEKSFKPSKEKHPFIIIGAPFALKAMREMGFKTFNEFWDEGYDEMKDHVLRMKRIVEICEEISRWDAEKILDFKRRVKEIVDHNYNIVNSNTSAIVADKIKTILQRNNPE